MSDLESFKPAAHGNRRLNSAPSDSDDFQQITIDQFAVISEPYHYALLELIKVKGFKWDTKWISQKLPLTISEVKIAVERLERVGRLARDQDNQLFDSTNGFSTDIREDLTTAAQRLFQQRSLEKPPPPFKPSRLISATTLP